MKNRGLILVERPAMVDNELLLSRLASDSTSK